MTVRRWVLCFSSTVARWVINHGQPSRQSLKWRELQSSHLHESKKNGLCWLHFSENVGQLYSGGLVWLGWVLWHINHCRLFNAKSRLYKILNMICWLVGWLVGIYGISIFVGYLTPNPFYTYNLFFILILLIIKQFSLAWVHSLIVKNISISNYSSSYI